MTHSQIKQLYQDNGYVFFTDRYRANLFGRRNKDLMTVDKFNDVLGAAYIDGFGNAQCLEFAGTTKPGLTSLSDKPMNANGTFILAPGQHLNCWKVGFHHADDPAKRYEAYQQAGSGVFKGWRDNDQDGKFDFAGKIYTDVGGLNGHRAGINDTINVGPYSYACQVVQDDKEFLIWLAVGKRSAEIYGNLFHYTLFQDA